MIPIIAALLIFCLWFEVGTRILRVNPSIIVWGWAIGIVVGQYFKE